MIRSWPHRKSVAEPETQPKVLQENKNRGQTAEAAEPTETAAPSSRPFLGNTSWIGFLQVAAKKNLQILKVIQLLREAMEPPSRDFQG